LTRPNLLAFGSATIAAIYKDRWEIELFFKALKQNLKVRSFVGTSENALRVQIWTALLAMLLLKWLHHLSKAKWSLSNLASMLRMNLFTYRDLAAWLDNPLGTPPILPDSQQLTLALARFGTGYPIKTGDLHPIMPSALRQTLLFFDSLSLNLSCLGQQ
jgi:hypothetical protein